jgi:GAF domain-containing protein
MSLALANKLGPSLVERDAAIVAQVEAGDDLSAILDGLLTMVEAASSGDMMASILLLEDGRLLHGSAPSLPETYSAAIHGIEIGPGVGSCGTAAYLGHPVYVTDIASDELWNDFRDVAMEHGLRACWSTPFNDDDGAVLGTFAVYHRTPRSPTLDELESIRMISASVALAVQRHKANRPQS